MTKDACYYLCFGDVKSGGRFDFSTPGGYPFLYEKVCPPIPASGVTNHHPRTNIPGVNPDAPFYNALRTHGDGRVSYYLIDDRVPVFFFCDF